VQLLWKEFCSPQRTIEQQGRPNEGALLALIKELDAGAADLDALLEFANAAPIRLSSAVAKCIPIGHRRGWKPRDSSPVWAFAPRGTHVYPKPTTGPPERGLFV
jgi:hypothetical protein